MAKTTTYSDHPLGESDGSWSKIETKMAFVLYMTLKPGELSSSNPDVQILAQAIHRTPGAVSFKLGNIAHFDEKRLLQGKVGLSNASKKDRQIWEEYALRGDIVIDEGIALLKKYTQDVVLPSGTSVHYEVFNPKEGFDKVIVTTARTNQQYFRNTLLENYGKKCCLTGLSISELLVASHIKPWSVSDPKTERLNPANGLLLNALHDRAFDQGLITLNKKYEVVVSKKVKHNNETDAWLYRYAGQQILLPSVYPPSLEFLEYHNDEIFKH